MSITKQYMEALERERAEKTYRVIIRRETQGLGDVTFPETQTLFMGNLIGAKKTVEGFLSVKHEGSSIVRSWQIWVECDNFIVAIVVHGALLWLHRVPPPKYWLNVKNRPRTLLLPDFTQPNLYQTPTSASSCGIPLPSCLTERICR